jgi:hypothetical protein
VRTSSTCGASAALALVLVLSAAAPNGERLPTASPASHSDRIRLNLLDDMATADLAVHGEQPSYLPFVQNGQVSVVLVTEPGQTTTVIRHIRDLHGSVDASNERVGYVRARVPVAAWPAVRQAPGVDGAQLDARRLPKGWSESGTAFWNNLAADAPPAPRQRSAQSAHGEAALPELSTMDRDRLRAGTLRALQVDTLAAEHPTFDGRGIGIAIVEPDASSADSTHPAFGRALALDGTAVPKVTLLPGRNRAWATVAAEWHVTSTETVVRLTNGVVLTLPRAGTFSVGRLHLAKSYHTVVWDRATGETWVDTDQDQSFQNETRHVPGQRGAADGTVAVFPGEPGWRGGRFTTVPSQGQDEITVVPFEPLSHAAMTASVAAGSDIEGNAAVGIAPAARLVFINMDGTSVHAMLEALLTAAADPRVDLISVSAQIGESLPSSDEDVLGLVIDRMTAVYGKLIVRSAGNGYVPEAIHHGAGSRALSVGAALTPIAAEIFSNVTDAADLRIWPYSNRGPRANGRGGVDVVGPTNMISATSCHPSIRRRVGRFQLPACTSLSAGTSAAAPIIAGVAARLLSGLAQQGISATPDELAWALRASARPLAGYRAMDQGAGIPQASAAWRLLGSRVRPPRIETWSSLTHPLAAYRHAKGAVSLYERDGWGVGQSARRTITFLRRDGPPEARTYAVVLEGNDGTFSAPRTLTLPLGTPVELPLEITARSSGFHNVMVVLQDAAMRTIHEQQATIAVADTFGPRNVRPVRYGRLLDGTQTDEHVLAVPPGLQGLRVAIRMQGSAPDQTAMVMFMDPRGSYYDRRIGRAVSAPIPTGAPVEFTIPDPTPGTWLITVIPNGAINSSSDQWKSVSVPYELEVTPLALKVASKTLPPEATLDVSVENAGGPFEPFEPSVELATTRQTDARFGDPRKPLVFPVNVEPGTSSLGVRARTPAPCGLHMYLYDCTTGTCVRHDALLPAHEQQAMRVRVARPGAWKAAVTPGPTCTGGEAVRFETLAVQPGLGVLTPLPASLAVTSLKPGQRWNARYRYDLNGQLPPSNLAVLLSLDGARRAASTREGESAARDRGHGEIVPFGYVVPLPAPPKETAERR